MTSNKPTPHLDLMRERMRPLHAPSLPFVLRNSRHESFPPVPHYAAMPFLNSGIQMKCAKRER